MISDIINSIKSILNTITTASEEKKKIELALAQLELEIPKQQFEVNKIEAQSSSVFVAGWRPFIGWISGSIFSIGAIIDLLIRPILSIWNIQMIPVDWQVFMPILMGMLGFGTLRSFDKLKGTDTKIIYKLPEAPKNMADIPAPAKTI